jgi:hypothetical protein
METDPVWAFWTREKISCPCHQSEFIDNRDGSLVTIPQIGLVPAGFTICSNVFEESHILPRNYSIIESIFTSSAYSLCGDTPSSPNHREYCIAQCLVCKELDMMSIKAAVSYFDIRFLYSPTETEEN